MLMLVPRRLQIGMRVFVLHVCGMDVVMGMLGRRQRRGVDVATAATAGRRNN